MPPFDDCPALREALLMVEGRCPLKGHDEPAELVPNEAGDLVLACSCRNPTISCQAAREHPTWVPLSDVFAAHTRRYAGLRLPRSYRYVWRMLLAHRAGLLVPEPVELVELAGPGSGWPPLVATRDLLRSSSGWSARSARRSPRRSPGSWSSGGCASWSTRTRRRSCCARCGCAA